MIELLRSVLALDSISPFLEFYHRMEIHKIILEQIRYGTKIDINNFSPMMQKVMNLIKQHNWERPERKYNEGRLNLLYYDEYLEQWQPIENYKHEIINDLKTI